MRNPLQDRAILVFDALTDPSGSAAAISGAVPGAAATAVLALLDPEQLDAAGRVDLLVGIERQLAWLAGLQQRVLASMHANRGQTIDPIGRDWTQEDVACALRLSGPTAQARLDVAVALTSRLPDTLALHARCLADAVEHIDDEAARRVEARVHRRASEQTVGQFRSSVARAVLAADPRDADQRHTDAMGPPPGVPHAVAGWDGQPVGAATGRRRGRDHGCGERAGRRYLRRRRAHCRPAARRAVDLAASALRGQVIDYGPRTYRPPADLRRLVIARDQTCAFSSCGRQAEHCDLDHRIRRVDGGQTSYFDLKKSARISSTGSAETGSTPSGY